MSSMVEVVSVSGMWLDGQLFRMVDNFMSLCTLKFVHWFNDYAIMLA